MFQVRRRNENDLVMRQNAVALEDGTELEYLTFPLLEELGVAKHLFTTRLGGVSKGEFSSMNLSFTRGDSHGDVLANYERIAGILGCRTEDMAASHQTHTTNIRRVGPADRGKGIVRERDYENVDGLITDEPGLALVTYYADCVPLYFVDPVHRAIGLAHSGWRGTVGKMGKRMTEAMGEQFGSRPEELYAAIGPAICRDCYEVGRDVAGQFGNMAGSGVVTPGKESAKYQLDLWFANKRILEEAGILKSHISVADICTCHNSGYLFSHRASGGRRGNLGAFLMLVPKV